MVLYNSGIHEGGDDSDAFEGEVFGRSDAFLALIL